MKNQVWLLALVGLMLAVSMISCTKESLQETTQPSQTDLDPESRILHFMQKMNDFKNGKIFKTDEKISIDSAIWYIDATLNYHYARADHPFGELHIDTANVVMDVLDSYEAMYEKVFNSYEVSRNGLCKKYHAIDGENKQFLMAIVLDKGPLPNNKRQLQITTYTGTGTLRTTDDFGPDDAYLYNRNATMNCAGDLSAGAPIIFEALLNNHYNPEPNNNCRWYFYGETTTIELFYQDYQLNNQPINYLDYKIFTAADAIAPITDITKCLEWNQNNSGIHEMQFYYDYLIELIDLWLYSAQNNNKWFAPSMIESVEDNFNGYRIYHKPKINFRKRAQACNMAEIPPSTN